MERRTQCSNLQIGAQALQDRNSRGSAHGVVLVAVGEAVGIGDGSVDEEAEQGGRADVLDGHVERDDVHHPLPRRRVIPAAARSRSRGCLS